MGNNKQNSHGRKPSRRQVLTRAAECTVAGLGAVMLPKSSQAQDRPASTGRVKQATCQWCYGGMSLDDLCAHGRKIGLAGIDLVGPNQWKTLQKYGMVGTMTPSHGIGKGLNRIENHAECLAKIRTSIEQTAEIGFPNVICFSGNRAGMDDAEGLKNCAIALNQVVGLAEQKNVTICMELLNSKRNHKDYMCDRTHWGVALAKAVGSPRFKLLYDIYHMQVQEGDVIATIRESHEYIGHYHTAGVPGRNEIEEDQELYYPAIVKAIADTGFEGYMAHEFIPKKSDKLASLTRAVEICHV